MSGVDARSLYVDRVATNLVGKAACVVERDCLACVLGALVVVVEGGVAVAGAGWSSDGTAEENGQGGEGGVMHRVGWSLIGCERVSIGVGASKDNNILS